MNLKNSEETLMDLGKKGERTYCDHGSNRRAMWNSGANRLMQRPTAKRRRSSAMAAVLGCRGVARRKKKRRDGGKKGNDHWPYL